MVDHCGSRDELVNAFEVAVGSGRDSLVAKLRKINKRLSTRTAQMWEKVENVLGIV